MITEVERTRESFSFLWMKANVYLPVQEVHFKVMQEIIQQPIVNGKIGIDLGSGYGIDTYTMASNNPHVKVVSLDLSDGIYKTKELASGLNNVYPIKSSVLDIPLKDGVLDFAYSFGVLHHIPDPERGLAEISRVLKDGSFVYLYLYEDHSDNPVKYASIKFVSLLRRVTTLMPYKLLYVLCFILSPFMIFIFTYPSSLFGKFKATRPIGNKIPFNFGTGPFSLAGDLYDRFSTPIEYRYNRQEVFDILRKNKFIDIKVEKMKTTAGWVAWGKKTNA